MLIMQLLRIHSMSWACQKGFERNESVRLQLTPAVLFVCHSVRKGGKQDMIKQHFQLEEERAALCVSLSLSLSLSMKRWERNSEARQKVNATEDEKTQPRNEGRERGRPHDVRFCLSWVELERLVLGLVIICCSVESFVHFDSRNNFKLQNLSSD